MSIRIVVKKSTYFDSASLMSISARADKFDGVEQAFMTTATEMNKGMLKNLGLLTPELGETRNDDLMVIIKGVSEAANDQTLMAIDDLFTHKERGNQHEPRHATFASAKKRVPESSLAVISINGLSAARETRQALQNNLNVMLFSGDISLKNELTLKQLTHEKELSMMGPDYRAAIINSTALCFDSAMRRSNVGIIGASGTGGQELNVRIREFGGGTSQLIGTGRHGLGEKIGDLMMLDAIGMLETDPQTEIITLIFKPPASAVTRKVLERAHACYKPMVVCFLGRETAPADEKGLQFARGTEGVALKTVLLTGVKKESLDLRPLNWSLVGEVRTRLTPQQKYIRSLFCDGTLRDEAMFAAIKKHTEVYNNIYPNPAFHLKDLDRSVAHTFLDFSDDDFTNGKPYPTIDPTNCINRLLQEARDPEVGVIMMNFVLGFESHGDSIGVILDAIVEAKTIAAADGRLLKILGYVLRTDLDTPSLEKQCQTPADAGTIQANSSTNTELLAREFICKGEEA